MEIELWKDITGYEGKYQISNLGNVKSLDFNQQGYEQNLVLDKTKKGYLCVCLCLCNKKKRFQVHRLVAIYFIPNPENLPEVNHKKGIKTDNRATELEWTTTSGNKLHAFAHGLNKISDKCIKINTERIIETMSKPVAQYDKSGNLIKIHKSQADAAKETGLHQPNITHCLSGRYKSTGGFIWKLPKTEAA